jgi:hypothetical protein
MDADWSVELMAEDESLEFPWYARDDLCYVDVKQHPELLRSLSEVSHFPELLPAFTALNARTSPLHTAKCDVWFDEGLEPAEDVFGASCRLSCYLDVLFEDQRRFSFESHEAFAKAAAKSVSGTDDLTAAVEFVIRRCYFRQDVPSKAEITKCDSGAAACWREGFYVTVYVSGYGINKDEARSCWASALAHVTDAALRVAAEVVE